MDVDQGRNAPVIWYHTIELPSGPTPGEYDLRSSVAKLPFPASLTGMRCLDVGTHDGFWAFQMEAMGAAEVMACDIEDPNDIDWPEPRPALTDADRELIHQRKARFHEAHRALGSKVDHRYVSVYDLSPDDVGTFDLVHIGSLLHHLRDPVGALMSLRRVTRGELLVSAAISVSTTAVHPMAPVAALAQIQGQPFWQTPNVAGACRQIESAGFVIVRRGRIHLQRRGAGAPRQQLSLRPRHWLSLPTQVLYRTGVPHVGILARPVGSDRQRAGLSTST
jgi:2-polyprenyl-3-methyl-5-hydroxy-6-metoxy-1,4-benzoquinol methylase